jgi:hypothetical protein
MLRNDDGRLAEVDGSADADHEDKLVEMLAKAMKPKRKPFTGALYQPIHAPHDVDLAAFVNGALPEEWEAVEQAETRIIEDHQDAKLALLAKRYRLKPPVTVDEWKRLCIALATETVPGFEIRRTLKKPTRGRQPKQFTVGGTELLDAITERQASHGGTIKDAIMHLLKHQEPWRSAKPPAPSLQAQYSKEKHRQTKGGTIDASMNAKIKRALKANPTAD